MAGTTLAALSGSPGHDDFDFIIELRKVIMSNDKTYSGRCFCGAVELAVSGEPAGMGYCHCDSCRHWSASPVNAFTLWRPDAVRVTRGPEHVGTFNKTPHSFRK